MKNKLISLLLTVLLCSSAFIAASCGSDDGEDTTADTSAKGSTYNNDIMLTDVIAVIDAAYPAGTSFAAPDPNWIASYFGDITNYEGFTVKIDSTGATVDEYGIFKANSDETVAAAEEAVKAYLDTRMEAWMDEYMPEEKPKLENAEVKTYGRFVVYCILNEADTTTVLNALESAITVK